MILCVCPNPSIDLTVELDSLNVGRLNRVLNRVMTYSGKALNTAIGISRLGGKSFATGFMFSKDGALFSENLENNNVDSQFIWNEGNVRINYKVIDNRSMLTEINDRGDIISEEKQEELLRLVEELSKEASIVIISGSLPQGVSDDYYTKLIRVIPKDKKVIVDTEGQKLISSIKEGVYLVKPNLNEFEAIIKKQVTTLEEYVKESKVLIDMGAKNVLLSLGRDGAILTNGDKSYYCKSTTVAINSTVGAGDSMVAAASLMIEQGLSMEEILKCAVAAGTASITTPGTNLFYNDKFLEIYNKLSVIEI